MARTLSIAACQFALRPVGSFAEFAEHARGLLDGARGADLVLFPELFTIELFASFPGWREAPLAELARIDEHTEAYRGFFAAEARARRQVILAGSHLVREAGRTLNVAHLFEPGGRQHRHAKTHIFPAESAWNGAEGDRLQAVDLGFARVGVAICYEAEIPECAASLAEQGAEIVLCPSFTLTEHGFWRVRHCAQARCVENQVFLVHCCAVGRPGAPLPDAWGRSSVLAPCDAGWPADGVLAEAEANREMVIRAEIDLDRLHENRQGGAAPTFRDRRRRASLYRAWPSHLRRPEESR
ncbi:MAG: carbon-nitrogen hydrolase family protein [Deltaproteobacteria bacterium]|nr:carbon-nitrogen hydrolase family protein [Deltaproteobacteria bacterium]